MDPQDRFRIDSVELSHVAGDLAGCPQDGMPQVAFLGRSNVGKSTLINSLLQRRRLARTSQIPGKTRTLNFYRVENRIHLVDLPGYGYAKASRKDSAAWRALIGRYLRHSEALRGLVHLVDLRHPPSALDRRIATWLVEVGVPRVVVATKTDKVSRNHRSRHLAQIKGDLLLGSTPLIPYSAKDRLGREELWAAVLRMAEGDA